ncbi:MAG: maleylacetoacetate isomerase [Hyphomonadaceae bacterium]
MMRLFGYYRSSAAYRCRIALNLKRVPHEQSFIHLRRGEQRSAEFLALNPQGLTPALETGDLVLTQSLAIIEWLEENFPAPALLPKEPGARARVRAFAQLIAADIHPLNNLRVLNFLRQDLSCDENELEAWRRRWIVDGLNACEALLARNGESGAFCFGEAPTLADVCLVPQVYSAERFGIDVQDWPRLSAVCAACSAVPAFADAHPSMQADAEL